MRNHGRTALAAAPLSLALLLAACGDDSADPTTTTTTTEGTTASSSETSGTTAPPSPPPAGESSAPVSDGPPSDVGEPLPEPGADWAATLVRAWGASDRERAAELGTPEVVDQVFGSDLYETDWALLSCDSTAVELYCTFTSPRLGRSLVTRQGGDLVSAVTFGTADPDGVTPELAGRADDLIRAWGSGDRDEALRSAAPSDVDALFRLADPGGTTWERDACFSLDDDPLCVYQAPDRDETVIVHLGEGTDLPVTYVFVYRPD
jgi:hypothetical protein